MESLVGVLILILITLAFVLHLVLICENIKSGMSITRRKKISVPKSALSNDRCKKARKKSLCNVMKKDNIVFNVQLKLEVPCIRCKQTNAKKNCSFQCCATCCWLKRNLCHAHRNNNVLAASLVESAKQNQVNNFDLSYAQIRKCPPGISNIGTQLVSLNLSNNRLSILPEDIGKLFNLEELFLQYNSLIILPNAICSLTKLIELDLKNNELISIPDAVGNMKKLQILNLTNNHISWLPNTIGNLSKIEELSVHSNSLLEFPDEICNLSNIRVIYAGENKLKTLPNNIGLLVRLEEFDISGCMIEYLPESLSECASLKRLWLSNNRLSMLPSHIGRLKNLKELHVRSNIIKYFPASIQKLQLYTFTAQNNKLITEYMAKTMSKKPSEFIAPLIEMTCRAVVKYKIPILHGSIPHHLEVMLNSPHQCMQCRKYIFHHYSFHITFETFGLCYKLPLAHKFCLQCYKR